VVVAARTDDSNNEQPDTPNQWPPGLFDSARSGAQHGDLLVLKMPRMDISSSQIRAACAQGLDVSAWLPTSVNRYIQQHRLYFRS
jgi:nicotinic acid mononucleotide adenylyltransferase